jgi:hypothetical protein
MMRFTVRPPTTATAAHTSELARLLMMSTRDRLNQDVTGQLWPARRPRAHPCPADRRCDFVHVLAVGVIGAGGTRPIPAIMIPRLRTAESKAPLEGLTFRAIAA